MRKNWMDYGNPDGPEAANYGIALPKWLILKENKYLVIGFYVFLFLLVLPIGVGLWWYNTVRFSVSKVLLITRNMFMKELVQNHFHCKRSAIQLLSRALEFSRDFNKEIILRSSDNYELSALIKNIPEFTIFKRAVIGSPYAIKAKALIYAHIRRLELPINLLLDKDYIIKYCPKLLNELIELCTNAIFFRKMDSDLAAKNKRMAMYLATFENFIDLSPMIFQAMTDELSPFMQLPHFSLTQIRALSTKAKNVKSIQQLAAMPEATRRNVLNSLTDAQYTDVINVLSGMPDLELDYLCEVIDDVDRTIRPMSIITCRIWLKRTPLLTMASDKILEIDTKNDSVRPLNTNYQFNNNADGHSYSSNNLQETGEKEKLDESAKAEDQCDIPLWDRSKKGIKKPKSKQGKSKPTKTTNKSASSGGDQETEKTDEQSDNENQEEEEETAVFDAEAEDKFKTAMGFKSEKQNEGQTRGQLENDEIRIKKLKSQKSLSVCNHLVHCPYFPVEKFEGWWVYLVDRRSKLLICEPIYVYALQEEFYLEFQFFAPISPGNYLFNLMVRSDCYVGFDYTEVIKFTVEKPVLPHPTNSGLSIDDRSDDSDEEETCNSAGNHPGSATKLAKSKYSRDSDSALESSSSDEYESDEEQDNKSFFFGIF